MHHRVDLPEKYEANCILKKPDKILAIRISMMLGILIAGLMMGRRRYVSVESAVQVLKKYIKYFVPDLPPWSSEIWQIISNELENKWSSDCVRVNVRQDRKKILTIARQECGYFSENSKKSDVNDNYDDDLNRDNLNESIGSDSDNDDDENDKNYVPENWYVHDSNEIEDFDVEIFREAWNKIIIKNIDSSGHQHLELRKNAWTDVIAFAFWEQYRLKCSFMFKKSVVSMNGDNYLSIYGYCKSKKCGNRLFGFIKYDPGEEGPVFITIKCRDTRNDDHEDFQRPLRGERRKVISKKVKDLGVLGYRKEAAGQLLKAGDTGCPFLPQSNVLYQAKKEFINAELGVKPIDKKNVFEAIDRLKALPNYKDSIHVISRSPFFIFYGSLTQMHCYKEYCRTHKNFSSISIDATGKFVRKIVFPNGEKSKYVFLYQIVVNFDKNSQSVWQMVSAAHDAETIRLWLVKWLHLGAKHPHEAVSDGSRAQLNAMSSAFNSMPLKTYIEICFKNLHKQKKTQINTYIRLDAAHFVHSITGWKCFKSVLHPSIKQFYTRCICLLIDCKNLDDFQRILLLILIICNVAHEDSIVDVKGKNISPIEARSELENFITCRKINKFLLDITEQIDKIEVNPEDIEVKEVLLNNDEDDLLSISTFLRNLLKNSKNVIKQGENLNCFYIPSLEKPLMEIAVEFPLWSNVCIPNSNLRATSSYIEEDFKDLRMVLKHKVKLPTDVYTFLKLHIDYVLNGVILFRAKLTKFISKHVDNPDLSQTNLLNSNLDGDVTLASDNNEEKSTSETRLIGIDNKLNFKISREKLDDNLFKSPEKKKKIHSLDTDTPDMNKNKLDSKTSVSLGNDDNNFHIDSNNLSNDLDYNLSDVTEQKNKNDEFDNWMGKGTQPEKYDWMLMDTSDEDKTKFNEKIKHDFNYPLIMNKDKHSSGIDIDGSTDNNNNNIEHSDYHIEDSSHDLENYNQSLEVGASYDIGCDLMNVIGSDLLNDIGCDLNDIEINSLENKNNLNRSPLSDIHINRFEDHDYSLKSETPRNIKEKKKTLSAAVKKVTREKINEGKYFQDFPEIKLVNDINSKKFKVHLLKNGNSCKPVRFQGYDWIVRNTCPFDTITQLLFDCALQVTNFREFCTSSKNPMLNFTNEFINEGLTNNIYKKRLEILYPFYKETEKKQQKITDENHVTVPLSRVITCEDNVSSLWARLFASEPSVFEKISCPTPKCINNDNAKNVTILSVNHSTIIRSGFGALEKALDFHSCIYNMRCQYCHGNKKISKRTPNLFIYIELDVRKHGETEGRSCKLRELPVYLNLEANGCADNLRYRLSGVAGYSTFHYIAYCRRVSGSWISYNDNAKKPEMVGENLSITPHGVLYIRS